MILTRSEEERRSKTAEKLRKERRRRAAQMAQRPGGSRSWFKKQSEKWRGRLFYHYKRDRVGDVDGAFLDRLLEAQEGRCAYCEIPMGDDVVCEHVIPHARGGRFTKDNIVLACWDCNDRKRAENVDAFLRDVPSLSERIE